MDFAFTPQQLFYRERIKAFLAAEIIPRIGDYEAEMASGGRWKVVALIEELKVRAKAQGLWNLFMPPATGHDHVDRSFSFDGPGLTNLEFALCAEEMGRIPWSLEIFNCSPPDASNMEVLHRYGTRAQKDRWLAPLMDGIIRSAFLMTEPDVASSDATNIETSIVRDGDDYVVNGRKWWASGVGDPRCEMLIVMGKTDPQAPRHVQQSMILVPRDTPGVTVVRHLSVFGYDDAPHGHSELLLEDVRVPVTNLLLGEGRGFEIAQGRLGPGRIHHSMRTIGVAEQALEKMARRLTQRTAFGRPLSKQSLWEQRVGEARTEIEMCRLLCLKAADMMDRVGNREARTEIAMIKVAAPRMALRIIDDAIQAFGGAGVAEDAGLARAYAAVRALRILDGPDEVHKRTVARLEFAKYDGAAR